MKDDVFTQFYWGVQIRGGGSISASGFGPGGPNLGESKSAGTPVSLRSERQLRASTDLE